MTLNHLEDVMQQFYHQSSLDKGQSRGKGNSGEKEEMVLNMFDGICYLCQKKRHKAHFCPTKQSIKNTSGSGGNSNRGKGQRFTGTCYNCAKQGHQLQHCWEMEENKHKHPHNFKPRGQNAENGGGKGNVNVDGNVAGEVKLLLSCINMMNTDGSGSDMVDYRVRAFELVDCDVGPWDMSFDDDDVVEIENCDWEMLQDQEDVSECNLVVRKTVTGCKNEVCEENSENNEEMNDSVQGELMMVNLSFPCRTVLLSDPNVWLADTAATVHTTSYGSGLIVTKGATAGESITVGNGTLVAVSAVDDISGVICDQYGVEAGPGKLREVSHLPEICSVCRNCRMKGGYCMVIKTKFG